MGIVLNTGIDYTKWQAPNANANANATTATATNETYQTNPTNNMQNMETDEYVSSKEKCTDGKDDGKIGFFSAVGHTLKGAGKTIVNGVKGMFTNKEGKFSLGKTIASVGIAAACIAFPAVGVAACAIGGVMGAVQIGKGVYNAAKADTDAEAKEAWQNIGGGAITVAGAVVGAKAGVKAVKGSSTAGLSGLDDAAALAAKADGKTSALSQLDDAANIGQKALALGKDMLSSSKNNITSIKNTAINAAGSETGQQIINAAKNPVQTAKNLFDFSRTKITKENIGLAFDAVKKQLGKIDIKNIGGQLSNTGKTILTELQKGTTTFADIVSKYGFDEVSSVLKYLGGTAIATE